MLRDCSHLGCKCCIVQLQQNLHLELLWKANDLKATCRKILTNQLHKTSLCETNHYGLNQEMLCILGNPKTHQHAHNSPPLVPFLSLMNQVHRYLVCLQQIVILATFSEWSISSRFSHKNPISLNSCATVFN